MIVTDDNESASSDKQVASHFYHNKKFGVPEVKILPGEYYVTDKDKLLVTTLGSCVAACIHDSRSGVGGMNHFMLPESNASDSNKQLSTSARYGAYAMEILINQLLKLGAHRTNLRAKLFGGGNILKEYTQVNIGKRNADFALRYLETENIQIIAKDLIDIYPRKILFFPKTGKAFVKKLKDRYPEKITELEENHLRQVNQFNHPNNASGVVELF